MTRRDLYLAALCDGLTGREVAARYGVRPSAVSMATGGRAAHRERNAAWSRRKRGTVVPRDYHCSSCGGSGHNRSTCEA